MEKRVARIGDKRGPSQNRETSDGFRDDRGKFSRGGDGTRRVQWVKSRSLSESVGSRSVGRRNHGKGSQKAPAAREDESIAPLFEVSAAMPERNGRMLHSSSVGTAESSEIDDGSSGEEEEVENDEEGVDGKEGMMEKEVEGVEGVGVGVDEGKAEEEEYEDLWISSKTTVLEHRAHQHTRPQKLSARNVTKFLLEKSLCLSELVIERIKYGIVSVPKGWATRCKSTESLRPWVVWILGQQMSMDAHSDSDRVIINAGLESARFEVSGGKPKRKQRFVRMDSLQAATTTLARLSGSADMQVLKYEYAVAPSEGGQIVWLGIIRVLAALTAAMLGLLTAEELIHELGGPYMAISASGCLSQEHLARAIPLEFATGRTLVDPRNIFGGEFQRVEKEVDDDDEEEEEKEVDDDDDEEEVDDEEEEKEEDVDDDEEEDDVDHEGVDNGDSEKDEDEVDPDVVDFGEEKGEDREEEEEEEDGEEQREFLEKQRLRRQRRQKAIEIDRADGHILDEDEYDTSDIDNEDDDDDEEEEEEEEEEVGDQRGKGGEEKEVKRKKKKETLDEKLERLFQERRKSDFGFPGGRRSNLPEDHLPEITTYQAHLASLLEQNAHLLRLGGTRPALRVPVSEFKNPEDALCRDFVVVGAGDPLAVPFLKKLNASEEEIVSEIVDDNSVPKVVPVRVVTPDGSIAFALVRAAHTYADSKRAAEAYFKLNAAAKGKKLSPKNVRSPNGDLLGIAYPMIGPVTLSSDGVALDMGGKHGAGPLTGQFALGPHSKILSDKGIVLLAFSPKPSSADPSLEKDTSPTTKAQAKEKADLFDHNKRRLGSCVHSRIAAELANETRAALKGRPSTLFRISQEKKPGEKKEPPPIWVYMVPYIFHQCGDQIDLEGLDQVHLRESSPFNCPRCHQQTHSTTFIDIAKKRGTLLDIVPGTVPSRSPASVLESVAEADDAIARDLAAALKEANPYWRPILPYQSFVSMCRVAPGMNVLLERSAPSIPPPLPAPFQSADIMHGMFLALKHCVKALRVCLVSAECEVTYFAIWKTSSFGKLGVFGHYAEEKTIFKFPTQKSETEKTAWFHHHHHCLTALVHDIDSHPHLNDAFTMVNQLAIALGVYHQVHNVNDGPVWTIVHAIVGTQAIVAFDEAYWEIRSKLRHRFKRGGITKVMRSHHGLRHLFWLAYCDGGMASLSTSAFEKRHSMTRASARASSKIRLELNPRKPFQQTLHGARLGLAKLLVPRVSDTGEGMPMTDAAGAAAIQLCKPIELGLAKARSMIRRIVASNEVPTTEDGKSQFFSDMHIQCPIQDPSQLSLHASKAAYIHLLGHRLLVEVPENDKAHSSFYAAYGSHGDENVCVLVKGFVSISQVSGGSTETGHFAFGFRLNLMGDPSPTSALCDVDMTNEIAIHLPSVSLLAPGMVCPQVDHTHPVLVFAPRSPAEFAKTSTDSKKRWKL